LAQHGKIDGARLGMERGRGPFVKKSRALTISVCEWTGEKRNRVGSKIVKKREK